MGKIIWNVEQIRREEYQESGSQVIQLTSASAISNNIYCEQPYCSSDGTRVAVVRTSSTNRRANSQLLIADLSSGRITLAENDISLTGLACSAWGNSFYYLSSKERNLMRISYKTLQKEPLFSFNGCPLPQSIGSVSPDHRYYVNLVYPPRFGIVRIDLRTKEWKIIHQHPDNLNPHTQFNPVTGTDIMVQCNRGSEMDADGNVTRLVGPEGATLYLIDRNGKHKQELPVGQPYTQSCTGHECFIADTGCILFTICQDANRSSNLLSVAPGDTKARVVCRTSLYFLHVSASKCGCYFVADCPRGKRTPIVIGNIETGKFRTLCLSEATTGSSQYTHVHPYMTADNKWVIFNSDRTGVPQVYAASIPQEVLESLNGSSERGAS